LPLQDELREDMSPGPPGSSRPRYDGAPVRILFAVFGVGLWMLGQARLDGLFSFLGNGMASYAAGGLLAAAILWPFWKRFRLPVGIMGFRNGFPAAMAALALLAPFLATAVSTDPVWAAPNLQEWFTMAASLLLLAAAEEIVCRGFLMDVLSIGGRVRVGLLLSSAVFAGLHIWNHGVSFAGIANIFLAGILFGLLRLTTGGLPWPVALHWVWNLLTGMVFGWSVSGHEFMPTLFACGELPPWGAFGPEESVLMTIGIAGASLLLLRILRPGLNSTQIE
jgi:uncharacterized protein